MRNRFLVGAIAGVAAASGLLVLAPGAMASGPQALTEVVHRWRDISPQPGSKASAEPLSSVFCFASGKCLAVGNRGNAIISRFWTGTHWSGRYSGHPNEMVAASCATASSCMAVGQIEVGHELLAAAEHWDGTSWSMQQIVLPVSATYAFMDGVSCPAANSCIAIGGYLAGKQPFIPIAERWNGKRWAMQIIPGPPRKTFASFAALSCPAVRSCVAVGMYQRGAFGETWNGARWKAQLIPQPSQATAEPDAVSCTSATSCLTVGGDNEGAAFAAHWNGRKWSKVASPGPSPGEGNGLSGVSTLTPTEAWAVGSSGTLEGWRTMVLRWNGKAWKPVASPDPGSSFNILDGVSAVSASDAWAVGNYSSNKGNTQITLILRWNGKAWIRVPSPSPNPNSSGINNLAGVSAVSPGHAFAAGSSNDAFTGVNLALIVGWNGKRWARP